MKSKVLILLSALMFASVSCMAQQKYACVNTDYVLRSIPDYTNAQKRLDKYVEDWTAEFVEKQSELENLRAEYEQESYLLPENLKKRRQEEIKSKEQEVRALQQQRFGPGGDLDRKRAELLKPVQDRVYAAIERIAQEKNYGMVFDKAGSPAVLFANKKYDISDEVLESLGYNPNASSSVSDGDGSKKKPTNPELRQRDGDRPSASQKSRDTQKK
jgi:outer membrane protein